MPYPLQFRDGEEEAMRIITKVRYETKGSDVLVANGEGMAKGTTVRYTMPSPSNARSAFSTLRRMGA
jgi:hypothetical protein